MGPGATGSLDKTPRMAFIAEQLADWFPDARFIHIVRDGRDVAMSWSQKPWLGEDRSRRFEPGGYRYGPVPRFWVEEHRLEEFRKTSTLHRAIWGWRRHVLAASEGLQSIESSRSLEIRYEELVKDPGRVAVQIAGFLGCPPMAPFWRAIETADASSVGRFDAMTSYEREVVEAEAGVVLRRLGYA